jgi:hypothetical protein
LSLSAEKEHKVSYYRSSDIQEQRSGSTTIEVEKDDDVQEFELTVTFQYHEWSEGHPYGDADAYEHFSETDDEEYELDSNIITHDELLAQFGDEVQKAIERAIENAN